MVDIKCNKGSLYISQSSGTYHNGISVNLKDIDSKTLDNVISVLADEYARRDI